LSRLLTAERSREIAENVFFLKKSKNNKTWLTIKKFLSFFFKKKANGQTSANQLIDKQMSVYHVKTENLFEHVRQTKRILRHF